MITYNRSAFGLNLLFRIHGSAVYRAVIPAYIAVAFFLVIRYAYHKGQQGEEMMHPYAIGVVVSGITFLIIFRASQGYSRYWEATSAIYQMQSKWMDASTHTACYHMQCDHYDAIKPPSFYDFPELNADFLTRDRERIRQSSRHRGTSALMHHERAVARSINSVVTTQEQKHAAYAAKAHIMPSMRGPSPLHQQSSRRFETANSSEGNLDDDQPRFLQGRPRLDGNWGPLFPDGKATFFDPAQKSIPRDQRGFASTKGGRAPALFLQELAHLSSLLTAVAMSTLRNDVDGAESPLDFYQPGDPWPEVDPGHMPELHKNGVSRRWATLKFFMGMGRNAEERTRYNASRPLPVIGGVSDNEIIFLQLARGPYAKTQLCWCWLSEFITREHLAGSLGKVGPPIVSRIIQFLGDGMAQYNHARKIMFIPFPFPHAQLSAIFTLIMIPLIPFLMDQYCDDVWLGCTLTFLSVVCLSGIHEVARELENPFRNVPNELPVVTLMAEFNEALLTMYSGYHPDFFWHKPGRNRNKNSTGSSSQPTNQRSGSGELGVVTEEEADYDVSESSDDIAKDLGDSFSKQSAPSEEKKEDSNLKPTIFRGVNNSMNSNDDLSKNTEVDQLRAIVEQQGRLMEKMLKEQSRLNKMVQEVFAKKTS